MFRTISNISFIFWISLACLSTDPRSFPPVEFATVGKTKNGEIYHHLWSADEIDALLRDQGLAKVDDEPEAGDIK